MPQKEIGRLNKVIDALERGGHAFMAFAKAEREEAIAFAASPLDGVLFEMEHSPWDGANLRDALQYMLDRRQIASSGTLAPSVAPFVRIPANGAEMNQWLAKQALDSGVYGVVWPHVSTVEQAMNAVTACRYARPLEDGLSHPPGRRGDGPKAASRYWGLKQAEYYARADVWPLNPAGEILCMLMIESVEGMKNLREMLAEVPGIGIIMIGEGDLSQALGHPRDYEHPVVREAMTEILAHAREADVPVGHPHVTAANAQKVIEEGYRILFTTPQRSYAAYESARTVLGRD
ncbi:HpcH/HpaI aldolase family protein [Chelativorans salis]|uniref:Aldolase/citrate lyase family protein n=1 Tax=Chelativorans salis TaxID=2978478 RepID=A0ABT2LQF0_9HYPH|nr:aldolase/citrate lyase family protein [Chelativorans sp. EGI FJ00035]MCT7376775.1 aldolase/citrate lyase family protein [Chelativorans sp. EGI FJ00035]